MHFSLCSQIASRHNAIHEAAEEVHSEAPMEMESSITPKKKKPTIKTETSVKKLRVGDKSSPKRLRVDEDDDDDGDNWVFSE